MFDPGIPKDHDSMPTKGSDKEKALVHAFLEFSKFLLFTKIKCGVKKGEHS
jgi:hypothetical protein